MQLLGRRTQVAPELVDVLLELPDDQERAIFSESLPTVAALRVGVEMSADVERRGGVRDERQLAVRVRVAKHEFAGCDGLLTRGGSASGPADDRLCDPVGEPEVLSAIRQRLRGAL